MSVYGNQLQGRRLEAKFINYRNSAIITAFAVPIEDSLVRSRGHTLSFAEKSASSSCNINEFLLYIHLSIKGRDLPPSQSPQRAFLPRERLETSAMPSISQEYDKQTIRGEQQRTIAPHSDGATQQAQDAQHAQQANAPAVAPSAETLPALFWDSVPDTGSEHVDSLAMDAMMAELGPLQKAINLKVALHPLPAHAGPRRRLSTHAQHQCTWRRVIAARVFDGTPRVH